MSSRAELLPAQRPANYHFENWNDFWRQALRYHNAVHPGQDLVIDRINTLRQFMSEAAVEHLGGFMKPHPRYNTTKGWEAWVDSATGALRSRDSTIGSATKASEWIEQFKKGAWSASEFWAGLDSLVVYGDISSAEQRAFFWEAHSWEAQARLEKNCPYFNPLHPIWSDSQPDASEQAEQKLAQLMELAKWNELVARRKRFFLYSAVGTPVALVLAISFCMAYAHVSANSFFSSLAFICILATFTAFICSTVEFPKFMDARRKQRAFALKTMA